MKVWIWNNKQPAQPWEFRSKPAWQRLIIMIGGVVVNFILGFFIFAMILFTWEGLTIKMQTSVMALLLIPWVPTLG